MNGDPAEPLDVNKVSKLMDALQRLPALEVRQHVPLKDYTRFGVGGPAAILVETASLDSFVQAVAACRQSGFPSYLIGEGSNLIASDRGFDGIVLRWTACSVKVVGVRIEADAGAELLDLVGAAVAAGLQGIETLAGIPGSVGAAIYGNAGAYGHSISERLLEVRFLRGEKVERMDRSACRFQYRDSLFKQHKDWFILDAVFEFDRGDSDDLRRIFDSIVTERDRKFPPEMRCAGSIFKNLLAENLPARVLELVPPAVIREGKVPAGWFLEQVGAKGVQRGGIRVAGHHANLLYNAGSGTAAEIRDLIIELKRRVADRYGIVLEEEVQYLGDF